MSAYDHFMAQCEALGIPNPVRPLRNTNPAHALQRKLKKAYRSTTQYRVDQLLASQSRWQRKVTIAQNKLAAVRRAMDKLLLELAAPAVSDQDKQ